MKMLNEKSDSLKLFHILNENVEVDSCGKKKKLKEDDSLPEVTWENYEDYSEEEIEEINNILNNLNLTAIKHEGNKEQGYSVAVKDNSSGLVFWLDYIKEGPDIYGEFNQYIFRTDNSDDRIRQAIQTSMYEDGTTLAFEAMEAEGLQYLEDKGLVTYTDNNDMIFESSLTEAIKSYNETDYGYHNNVTTIYGELLDGNWYVYIPENDALDIYDTAITNKFIDTMYNYDDIDAEDGVRDDEWYDNFQKEHNITDKYDRDKLNSLEIELNSKYFDTP